MAAAERLTDDIAGESEVAPGVRLPVPRLAPPSPGRRTTGRVDAMAHYAGQSVGSVVARMDAGGIVRELADGAQALLTAHRQP